MNVQKRYFYFYSYVTIFFSPVVSTGVILAYPFPECPVSVPPDVDSNDSVPAKVELSSK